MSSTTCQYPILVLANLADVSYSLCDIVDHHRAVRIPVVHRRQRLVPLLTRCVPYLELDCCLVVEGYRLCEEGGADG